MELVSMTPPSELSVTIVARNISTFKYYTWESKATLMANVRVASLLFNHS